MFLRDVLTWLRDGVRRRRAHPCGLQRTRRGALMRVDAKAEGDSVAVGGWCPTPGAGGTPSTWASPWFAVTLSKGNAPWAYEKGEPYKTISSLELFATLLGIIAFEIPLPADGEVEGAVIVTGQTDSQVASNVLTKLMTSSFPLCCVLMELASRLERGRLHLDLDWAPRELNQEADDLSNMRTSALDPEKRVNLDITRIPWMVLDTAVASGSEYFAGLSAKRRAGGAAATPSDLKARKGERLDREPW